MTLHTCIHCIEVYMKLFMRPNIQREVEAGQRQEKPVITYLLCGCVNAEPAYMYVYVSINVKMSSSITSY